MHRKTIDVSSGAAARVRRGAAESAGGLGGLAEPRTSPRSHCRQTGDLGTAAVPRPGDSGSPLGFWNSATGETAYGPGRRRDPP